MDKSGNGDCFHQLQVREPRPPLISISRRSSWSRVWRVKSNSINGIAPESGLPSISLIIRPAKQRQTQSELLHHDHDQTRRDTAPSTITSTTATTVTTTAETTVPGASGPWRHLRMALITTPLSLILCPCSTLLHHQHFHRPRSRGQSSPVY